MFRVGTGWIFGESRWCSGRFGWRMRRASRIRCYEKVGFQRVGVMRQYERDQGGIWRDGVLLDLLARELS